ncbi:uncharacterized protein LOC120105831 [Phoenix dactylifera]|uniref:Uncharacterized protein LOC120105831 n=1 Tax=Phoenix dactylifera TaxID=42345 RepID=A0A8B8ZJY5_PHODC|nr:uncharacterized protein LOC120105831 [Phoenix dactylifera]
MFGHEGFPRKWSGLSGFSIPEASSKRSTPTLNSVVKGSKPLPFHPPPSDYCVSNEPHLPLRPFRLQYLLREAIVHREKEREREREREWSSKDPPSSELAEPNHGEHHLDPPLSPLRFPSDDVDSFCSTPYVSAPSSPGRGGVAGGYFFSAPTSPMHFILSSAGGGGGRFPSDSPDASVAGSFEFEFSARFPSAAAFATGSMTSADELFLNGQIRPMKLCSHLQRPQVLALLLDLNEEEDDDDESERHPPEMAARGRDLKLRSRSIHRWARSHSPLRNAPIQIQVQTSAADSSSLRLGRRCCRLLFFRQSSACRRDLGGGEGEIEGSIATGRPVFKENGGEAEAGELGGRLPSKR